MNVRPLRVLMTTARYLPLMGGTESHVYEVSRRLVRAGVDVTVLTTDPTGKLPPLDRTDGVLIQRVRAYPAQKDYYFAPGIYSTIVNGNWDLVHCQGIHTFVAPLAMLAAYRARIPYIVTFHTSGHPSRRRAAIRSLQWKALRPLLAHATRLIGVSQFEARLFQEQLRLPAERFFVIPSGGCLPRSSGPQELRTGKSIVSEGVLERHNGHDRNPEELELPTWNDCAKQVLAVYECVREETGYGS